MAIITNATSTKGTIFNDVISGTNGADTLSGGQGDDEVSGGNGNDHLYGSYGEDEVSGGNGHDHVSGGRDNDTLSGNNGNDTLDGGAGADSINGGAGTDTVDYTTAQEVGPFFGFSGVAVDLLEGEGGFGDSLGDTYVSIENVTGSAFNDMLVGNDGANVINGGNGDDYIDGADGNDTLNGGNGRDFLGYSESDAGVTVDLFLNFASGGDATGDQITGFEDVGGSIFNDFLFGNDDANRLVGNNGHDVIEGDGGNDTLEGEVGNDTLRGGNNDDSITGGNGNDFVDSGYDDDTMSGGNGLDTFTFEVFSLFGEHGDDFILDFSVTQDQLQFQGAFLDLNALEIDQVGANTVITYDLFEGSITLVGVDADALLANQQTAIDFV
jgi:Ca2+-binding RTX toxin-like protein